MTPKLLSEILNTTVTKVEIKDDEVKYNHIFKISTYKLMHLMKEWADGKGFLLESGLSWCNYYRKPEEETAIDYTMADTEFEAVKKACEWIMDNE